MIGLHKPLSYSEERILVTNVLKKGKYWKLGGIKQGASLHII
jgi:hypothetical protein